MRNLTSCCSCTLKKDYNTDHNRIYRSYARVKRCITSIEDTCLVTMTVAIFTVLITSCAFLHVHHDKDPVLVDPSIITPNSIMPYNRGIPETPRMLHVIILGHNHTGSGVIRDWLLDFMPSFPYEMYRIWMINNETDILCPEQYLRTFSRHLNPFLMQRSQVLLLMTVHEPVTMLARFIRHEHSRMGKHSQTYETILKHALKTTPGGSRSFSEHILHSLTAQVHLINTCDETFKNDITERFEKCYTYSVCDVAEKWRRDDTGNHRDRTKLSATRNYGLFMGMHDCIYEMWKHHLEQLTDNPVNMIMIPWEDLMRDTNNRIQRVLMEKMNATNVIKSALLESFHQSVHRGEHGSSPVHNYREDMDYLPSSLRRRLYYLYEYHVTRMGQVAGMDQPMYVYKRNTRSFKPMIPVL